MANFLKSFEIMMRKEGGYKLHTVKGDRGGMTYAGIARKIHPDWQGWTYIDKEETPPTSLVRDFYYIKFWNPINGEKINSDIIAETIFSFYVNTGSPAKKLAQLVVGATPDGDIGPKTIELLNSIDEELFVLRYALAKITRYRNIVMNDRSQSKFLLGWVNRALATLENN